jgi:hypothetical protein
MTFAGNVTGPRGVQDVTTPLHPKSNSMVECYVKTVEEHLRKAIWMNDRDLDERLPLFLLAYRGSTYETTGMMPINMTFRKELCLPCGMLFGAAPYKHQPVISYMMDLVEWLHDICRLKWLLTVMHLLSAVPYRSMPLYCKVIQN